MSITINGTFIKDPQVVVITGGRNYQDQAQVENIMMNMLCPRGRAVEWSVVNGAKT